MRLRGCWTVAVGVLAIMQPDAMRAQGAVPPRAPLATPSSLANVAVRGFAFDSVRGQPLRNAFVAIMGGAVGTTTDANGRFIFDSVAPGTHTFALQHAQLDSLGLSGLAARAMVTSDSHELTIAVPSFNTLWNTACRLGPAPVDTGFLFGTIRDAEHHHPVVGAAVRVSWIDMLLDPREGYVQRTWHIEVHSDSTGSFTVCGIPHYTLGLEMQATTAADASGVIDLPVGGALVHRRDLVLGPRTTVDASRLGTVSGVLTDFSGEPFFNARVLLDSLPETRSDAEGRFTLSDVPLGTRQLEVRSIGMLPVQSLVDVTPRDTTFVIMQLGKPTTLAAMHVERERRGRALAADFASRRKLGLGYTMDTTAILKYPSVSSIFGNMPALHVEYRNADMNLIMPDGHGGICNPIVRLDGVIASYGNIADLLPTEVAGIEVYPRATQVPAGYTPSTREPPCGMILVWTHYGFRER